MDDNASQSDETRQNRFKSSLRRATFSVEDQRKRFTSSVRQTSRNIQKRMGEDYFQIFETNPVVLNSMDKEVFLQEDINILKTLYNIPWATTALWSSAAGSSFALQDQIARTTDHLFHEGPGHLKAWDAVNKFMDSKRGRGHRLKHGHSIEALPQIYEQFGSEGVLAYHVHLLQDFMSTDGIPVIPNAWDIRSWLRNNTNVSSKTATGLVSISFKTMLASLMLTQASRMAFDMGGELIKKRKLSNYLENARLAHENHDYRASIENYKSALEVERSPIILLEMGDVYLRRVSTRLKAHQAYVDSLQELSTTPATSVNLGNARISLRGLVGIRALSTADVLEGIHPEHWNDHVQDIVNATVFSFKSTAQHYSTSTLGSPTGFSSAINYYLAAKSAASFPLLDERREKVFDNIKLALQALGDVAQYHGDLRQPTDNLKYLWALETVMPSDVEAELSTYL